MKIIVPGEPTSQCRPRFSRRGGRVLTFDPLANRKRAVKKVISDQLEQAISSENRETSIEASNLALDEFFHVTILFFISIPKSFSEAKRNAKLWGIGKHTSKPDLDNLEKFYLDCLTGIIFDDDSRVVRLESIKIYSDKPRTVIKIMGYKKSLGDEANGILELFGPDKLIDFLKISWELYDLYGYDEEEDWVEKAVGSDVNNVRLARTAYLLSALAEITHKPMAKIHRQFPDFYLRAERLASSLKS